MGARKEIRWRPGWRATALGLLVLACSLAASGSQSGADAATDATSSASGWKAAPVVPVIRGKLRKRLRARVARGRALGMRRDVFAKVGDSNIEMTPSLYGLACAEPVPDLPPHLDRVVRRYSRVKLPNERAFPGCEPWNSFSRRSAAARSGTFSSWSMLSARHLPDEGFLAFPEDCGRRETPLHCELRVTRPRYAFVLTGTNDAWLDGYLELVPGAAIAGRLKPVLKTLLAHGTVPILSSIPPLTRGEGEERAERDRFVSRTNAGILALSRKMRLPFVNLWRAMNAPWMIADGMAADGLHLSVYRADGKPYVWEIGPTTFSDSVVFTRQALRYGSNRRNLILLRTLARLDRATGRHG